MKERYMLRAAASVLALSAVTTASAQNRLPIPEPEIADYCMYGGQLYSLGASICVGRDVVIKCIRYSSVINDLRDLNANVDDQTRNRPVWLNVPQKTC
jgi:hypothetical protein